MVCKDCIDSNLPHEKTNQSNAVREIRKAWIDKITANPVGSIYSSEGKK